MQETDLKMKLEIKAELERAFGRAATRARTLVKHKVLAEEEVAELKGLFQQATIGDGNYWKLLNDPKFFINTDGVTKNQTWLPLRGMSKLEAMERYIDRVEKLTAEYHVIFPPSRTGSFASLASGSTCVTYLPR